MKFVEPLYRQLESYWIGFVKLLPQIGLALIVLVLTGVLASYAGQIVRSVLNTAQLRRALIDLVRTLTGLMIWVLGILLAITIVFPSMTPAQMFGALGIGGLAVGLAFRDIFENFMAGVMIILRKPMRIGDTIEVSGIEGQVEEITIRDTYLRMLSNELVLLPNSKIFKNPVKVKTEQPYRRYEIVVGIAYGEDALEARNVIRQAMESVKGIEQTRGIDVFARELASSSINFTVRWWAGSSLQEMHESRSQVVLAIKSALDEAGIEIPFPYRTLTFSAPLGVRLLGEDADAPAKGPPSGTAGDG